MNGILAMDTSGAIGFTDSPKLPWNIKEDLQRFKALTWDCECLVGGTTFKTLPSAAKQGRRYTIYTKETGDRLEELIKSNDPDYRDIEWCIGGKYVFEKFLPMINKLFITNISEYTDGDNVVRMDKNKLTKDFELVSSVEAVGGRWTYEIWVRK